MSNDSFSKVRHFEIPRTSSLQSRTKRRVRITRRGVLLHPSGQLMLAGQPSQWATSRQPVTEVRWSDVSANVEAPVVGEGDLGGAHSPAENRGPTRFQAL